LIQHYGLSEEQVEFFSAHDEIGKHILPVDEMLLARYTTPGEHRLITRAVRLSHEFELMFYDTILSEKLS
jgi:thiaminase/transcriptional activator TenA